MYDTEFLADEFAKHLLTYLRTTEDFELFEHDAICAGNTLVAQAISKALESFDNELASGVPGGWRVKEKKRREPLSEVGPLSFSRRIYIDEYGYRRALLDEVLDLKAYARATPGVVTYLTETALDLSYRTSARLLARHTHTPVSPTSVSRMLKEACGRLREPLATDTESLFELGVAPRGTVQAQQLCVEVDGVHVPIQKGRGEKRRRRSVEIKAMCGYRGKEEGKRLDTCHFAALSNSEQFWKIGVTTLGNTFDLSSIKQTHLGLDGAAWCRRGEEYLPGEVRSHLDPWHVSKSIRCGVRKEDRGAAYQLLYKPDIEGLVAFLATYKDTNPLPKTEETYTYIANNADIIATDGPCLGTQESTNAHLYAKRMKTVGRSWSAAGADTMAYLRSQHFSGVSMPAPRRQSTFSLAQRKHREHLFQKRVQSSVLTSSKVAPYDAQGVYEPPQGHIETYGAKGRQAAKWR